ncbi:MAG: acyl-CoA dehydrogenase family protein, partial [Parachlamydiaceae bacterium]
PLGRGEALAAFYLTEPNAGSDAAGITTTAVWDDAINKYRINGKKQWTTNGSIAKVITVMAKVDGKVTAFLVSPDMKGFEIAAKALDKVGMRGSTTSNINYNDVEVPKENILGPVGGGLRVCLTVLDYGRTTFGATCLGVAKKCLELSLAHAKTRIQFKRPLASFQLVKEKLAKMAAYTYAIEATTYLTAGLIDNGQEDVMLESAILKVFSSDSSWVTLYDTMQIFGGRSLFTDKPLERMMRDARLNMIGEGSNEVLRVFIAVVGLKGLGEKLLKVKNKPSKEGILSALKPFLPGIDIKADKYQFALDKLLKEARKFHRALIQTAVKYGEGVVEKQLILNRIAEMAIALYTKSAVISKLQIDPHHDEEGLLYLDYASKTFDANYKELFSLSDQAIEHTADKIIGKL